MRHLLTNQSKELKITLRDFYNIRPSFIEGFFMLMKKHVCNFIGCNRESEHKETYKVLDSNLGLYSFTTNVCQKHYEEIHNFKEKVTGDFSVFFKSNLDKSYYV